MEQGHLKTKGKKFLHRRLYIIFEWNTNTTGK